MKRPVPSGGTKQGDSDILTEVLVKKQKSRRQKFKRTKESRRNKENISSKVVSQSFVVFELFSVTPCNDVIEPSLLVGEGSHLVMF